MRLIPLFNAILRSSMNANGNRIVNVGEPTEDGDVATKKYVHDHAGEPDDYSAVRQNAATGAAHAAETGNPHNTTAEQVGVRVVELVVEDGAKKLYLMLNGERTTDRVTSYAALLAMAKRGLVRLYYNAVGGTGRKALYTAHMVDDAEGQPPAMRFDATGTLGDKVYTRSIAVMKSGEDGIAVSIGSLTELQKSLTTAQLANIDAVPQKRDKSDMFTEWTGDLPYVEGQPKYVGGNTWRWYKEEEHSGYYAASGNEEALSLIFENLITGQEYAATRQRILTTADVADEIAATAPDGKLAEAKKVATKIADATRLTPVYGEWASPSSANMVGQPTMVDDDGGGVHWEWLNFTGGMYSTEHNLDRDLTEVMFEWPDYDSFNATRSIDHYVTAKGEKILAGTIAGVFATPAFKTAVDKEIEEHGGGGGDIKPKINTFEQLKAYIDAKVADTSFSTDDERIAKMKSDLVGIEIEDTWANTSGAVYFDPMIIVNVGKWKGEDGEMHIGAMVMHKYATTETVVFDMANQEVASESTAQEGLYYYGLALGETTVTAAKLTLLDLAAGDALPKSEYKTIYKSAIRDTSRNILQFGHNNWRDSAYRQWLNSNVAKATSWWKKPYAGKVSPSNATTIRGYIQGCSGFNGLNADGTPKAYNNGILKFAKPVYITTSPNYVCDGGNNTNPSVGAYETLDLFFLPSGAEMYGNVNTTGSGDAMVSYEGEFSPYWKDATGFLSPNTTYSAARSIFTENGQSSASLVRLRSANRGYSYHVLIVSTSGNLSASVAHSACAAAPACVIY